MPVNFHIGGSDASGVVYAVGSGVENVAVGDHVVIHCGQWDPDDPIVAAGGDPGFAESYRIWGYESNWGSFAQFTKVQAQQLLPRPTNLSWAEASAYGLTYFTAYRMLDPRQRSTQLAYRQQTGTRARSILARSGLS